MKINSLSGWTSSLISMIWLILLLCGETESVCSVSQFSCADGQQCIPMSWKCDGTADCTDESDEDGCDARTCTANEFTCASGTGCVPPSWMCDGDADCPDGSDEVTSVCTNNTCDALEQFTCMHNGITRCLPISYQCDDVPDCPDGSDESSCSTVTCDADSFSCSAENNCIPLRWVCDGENECSDGSDEANCSMKTCAPDNFLCATDLRCIPNGWRCDGDYDCMDHSDESECPSEPSDNMCFDKEFMCADRETCIHLAWKCDGDVDCNDGSDEDGCTNQCEDTMFKCSNGDCIPQSNKCDGHEECSDGTDELGCEATTSQCSADQFDCSPLRNGVECFAQDKWCDAHQDCMHNEDELFCTQDPCLALNCEGSCVHVTANQSICTCEKGYKLGSDGQSCQDVDECLDYRSCTQVCHNLPGNYTCKCHEGYTWIEEKQHCSVKGPEPLLIFANRVNIRELSLHTGGLRPLIDGTKNAIAIDFDYRQGLLMWSDVATEEIRLVKVDAREQRNISSELLVHEGIRTPDGLAYDWVHHNLYWTDTGHNTVSVVHVSADEKQRHRRTLFETNIDEPRAIVVDPRHKQNWMYWTDWGTNPKIERAGLDGSRRSVIFNDADHMTWPNGLTIDYESNRLFWVDAKLQLIASVDLNGMEFRMVTRGYSQSSQHLKHPFAITVFEDYLYWTDWEVESINKVHKTRGGEVSALMTGLYSPMDLHVYHPSRQPASVNVCGDNNGGCSHLCLPTPDDDDNSARFQCLCPDSLSTQGKLLKYKLVGKTCHVEGTEPSDGGVDIPVTVPTTDPTKVPDNTPVGTIAAVVIGVIVALLLIAVLIGFVIYRRYTRLGKRSMNFDNPVYRKTTEDQFSLEKNQYQPTKPVPSTLEPLTASSNEYV